MSVNKDGASYGKGLLNGDIITKIDNVELNKMSELRRYIYTKNPGDTVRLGINRGGKEFSIDVQLGKKQ